LYKMAWSAMNPSIPANPNAVRWDAGSAEGVLAEGPVDVGPEANVDTLVGLSTDHEALRGKAFPRLTDAATQKGRASDRARVGRELADARTRAIQYE